jgi:hypothetical protein
MVKKAHEGIPGKGIYLLMAFLVGLFALSACEEEEANSGAGEEATIVENYARESQTVRVVGPEDMHAYTGNNPFLSVDGEGFHPQTGTLMIPGRSFSDSAVHPQEMLALFPGPEDYGSMTITNHPGGGQWYRFSGEEFIPGSRWTPGDDGLEVPGSGWMPEGPDSLEVLMYTGSKPVGELFGNADLSGHRIDLDEGESRTIQTDKSRIGVAVTMDQLYNIQVSPRNNLAEALLQDPEQIAFPVHPDSTTWVQPTDDFFTVREQQTETKGISAPLDVALISGKHFFPSEVFTPSNVSVFTIPEKELFPGMVYSGYKPSDEQRYPDLLIFGSDRFQEAPNERLTLHDAGEEMDVSGTRVVLPLSVLEIRTGLTLYLDPAVKTIAGSNGESYWPDGNYYNNEFSFRSEVFTPGAAFTFLKPGVPYSTDALMQTGISVDLRKE